MRIGVAICTIGRDTLKDTLEALIPQPFDRLVVQRDWSGATPKARNRSISGLLDMDWIAITDDDAKPDPDWIERGRIFAEQNPHLGGFHGHVYGGLKADERYKYIGANFWIKASVLEALGGFDEIMLNHEDTDLGWRLVEEGWEWGYAPLAKVFHKTSGQSRKYPNGDANLMSKFPERAMKLFKENIS